MILKQEGAAEPAPGYKPIYDPVMGLACDECLCDPNCSRRISSARESAIASAAIREDRTRIRNAVSALSTGDFTVLDVLAIVDGEK
jgi:hypothetical protein